MNMKKLKKAEWGDLKGYLSTGTIMEVMKAWHYSHDTVRWVDASDTWAEYMETYYQIKQQKEHTLRLETEFSARLKYVTPASLDEIKEQLNRIEAKL